MEQRFAFRTSEHDEHQGQTAAQAVPPMAYTQAPGRTNAFPIVVHEEVQWRAAHVQTALLEGTELKQTRDEECERSDESGMNRQPRPPVYQTMHQRISEKGSRGKGRPDHGIASQE